MEQACGSATPILFPVLADEVAGVTSIQRVMAEMFATY